jgi:FtsP/CotA-like multicopper oxidase with cupredoxin domain
MINVQSQQRTAWLARPTFGGVRLYSAALLTLGAAFVHLAVAPEHLREYLPFGIFFLAVGCAQIVLAVELVMRPTRRLALLMAAGSAALVALWFVSRTRGLPIGPTPGKPEDVGLADIICNILEMVSTLLFLALAAWPARRTVRRIWLIGLGSIPSMAMSLALTSVAVSATLNGMPEAANAAPPVAGQPTISVASLVEAPGTEPVKHFTLTAAVTQIDGQDAWALNGSVPGPELRVSQGDRVQVTLVNDLPEATTLHWHGVQLPNAEDGVAGVTQDAVPSGSTYTYEFVAREAGTFWYHSHQQTEQQLPRGLFGPLVVLPTAGQGAQQHDYTLLLHGSAGQVSINGVADTLHLDAAPGDTVRLRLINAVDPGMDGGPESPVLIGAPYQVVALDGHDLNAADMLGPTRVPLGMGQRADLVFTMPASGNVQLIDTELVGATTAVQALLFPPHQPRLARVTIGSSDATALSADADATAAVSAAPNAAPTASAISDAASSADSAMSDAASAPLLDVLHYGAPAPDAVATSTPDVTAPVVLAEHPGMRDGRPQLVHTINDQASPNVPPIDVTEGQIVRLHIVNLTGEYHPMHLHGHVFSIVAIDGQPAHGSPIREDSVLLGPNQTMDVAFAANNPGVWMFHCHVLLHAGMGMTTSINYSGYSTPFEMGTRSGNMPE